MRWMWIWIVGMCVWCMSTTPAYAQQKDLDGLSPSERETMVTFIKAGRDAFEEGRYDKALRAFDEAYFIHPLTELLYRIAQCHERLGHASKAAEFYKEYLTYAEDADEDKTAQIEDKILELEQLKETELTIRTEPANARVSINGQFEGRAPQTATLAETRVELLIEADGFMPTTQNVELEPGVRKEVFIALRSQDADDPKPVRPVGLTGAQKGGIGLMAGGGAVLIGGAVIAVFGAQTRSSLDELDRTMPRPIDYNERYERANFRSNLGLGLVGVGLVSASVGAWLFVSGTKETGAASLIEFSPLLGSSHQGATMRLSF